MAKTEERKSDLGRDTYPHKDTPFIFLDDISAIVSNTDLVRFYLLRDRPSLDLGSNKSSREAVAELGMGLRTFALATLEFHGVLRSMMSRGIFEPDEIKEFEEALNTAKKKPTRLVSETQAKAKK